MNSYPNRESFAIKRFHFQLNDTTAFPRTWHFSPDNNIDLAITWPFTLHCRSWPILLWLL